ncbi:hypothetical protein [Roseibium sp. RKSG952]|uniref:hypothetical protein n=1 Tax=Roseibium sp. RKSG952 TaxID=2529384 RepID=UPI0012BBE60A|nr:hypothetical protein [Roseibium sp. RKSG952]MTH95486.1 hypothetical protein [Roseibium sp. RKSG952]
MKRTVFCASLAALLLSGCGLTSRVPSSDTAVSPEWSDEWAEYSTKDDGSNSSWSAQSAWGNPPKERKEVVAALLPDIEETKPTPALSRPRFSSSEDFVDIQGALKVDRGAETRTLRPSVVDPPSVPSMQPGLGKLVRAPLAEPVKPNAQPIQPVQLSSTVINAQELEAPQLTQLPAIAVSAPRPNSGSTSVSARVVMLSPEVQFADERQALKTKAEVETTDPREVIEMAVAIAPKPDERVRSPWGDHVLTPELRMDLDIAVLKAVSSGSSAHTASDGTTKFWVKRKGLRGTCQVFEVTRGGTTLNSAIKDRGEAVFCGS